MNGLSPRVRGNLNKLQMTDIEYPGLSPRVRGNHRSLPLTDTKQAQGLSPRVRGNLKDTQVGVTIRQTVYPRVCGGTIGRSGRATESSRGSIPACAGEPYEVLFSYHHWSDDGLSPRVRGNPLGIKHSVGSHRSIPACAGEPYTSALHGSKPPDQGSIPACAGEPLRYLCLPGRSKVYPRVCGGTTWKRQVF